MTKKSRSTYQNCLRCLFRRGSCIWINACQIALMISFLLFIAGALVMFFMARFQHQKLLAEDSQYDKLKNEISFAHCDYISMEKEFNTQFCYDRAREYAFAWRYFKTNSTKNGTCFDIHEQVDCHTYLIQNNIKNYTRPSKFLMCRGLLDVKIIGTNDTEHVVWGPQIQNLTQFLNKTLHASELFVKCPKCQLRSKIHYPKKENQCYQKIETTSSGWPAIAEICDNMVILPPDFPADNCTNNESPS